MKRQISKPHWKICTVSPSLSGALQTLSKAARERTAADLADLIVPLHKDGLLSEYPETGIDRREPRVICSMGFSRDA